MSGMESTVKAMRKCESCGADISNRHRNARMCLDCYYERNNYNSTAKQRIAALEARCSELEHRGQRLLRQNHALGELYAKAMEKMAKLKVIYANQPRKAIGGYGQLLNVTEYSRWIDQLGAALAEGAEEKAGMGEVR